MKLLTFFQLISVLIGVTCSTQNSIRNITVMASQTRPFVFYENKILKGLDIDIKKSFTRKLNLNIKYFVTDQSLNELFSNENRSEQFFQMIQNS